MSYVGLFVQITYEGCTPKEIADVFRTALKEALGDMDVQVEIDEHSGSCSPEVCGEEPAFHPVHP